MRPPTCIDCGSPAPLALTQRYPDLCFDWCCESCSEKRDEDDDRYDAERREALIDRDNGE